MDESLAVSSLVEQSISVYSDLLHVQISGFLEYNYNIIWVTHSSYNILGVINKLTRLKLKLCQPKATNENITEIHAQNYWNLY